MALDRERVPGVVRPPQFEPITPDELGRVLDRRRIWPFYLQLLLVLFPVAVGGGGVILAEESTGDAEEVLAGVLIGLAVLSYVAYFVFESFLISHYPARWYLRWLRERVDRRPQVVVGSDDPSALFVQIIPRKNWWIFFGENASDVGLLVLDRERRELRYEGDVERWVVPAESVVATRLQSFTPPLGIRCLNGVTVLMLSVRVPDGDTRVIALAPQPIHFELWTRGRRHRRAELLERAIGHLVWPDRWPAVDEGDLWPLRPPRRSGDDADYGGPPER